jgi:ketopantoate reductase
MDPAEYQRILERCGPFFPHLSGAEQFGYGALGGGLIGLALSLAAIVRTSILGTADKKQFLKLVGLSVAFCVGSGGASLLVKPEGPLQAAVEGFETLLIFGLLAVKAYEMGEALMKRQRLLREEAKKADG